MSGNDEDTVSHVLYASPVTSTWMAMENYLAYNLLKGKMLVTALGELRNSSNLRVRILAKKVSLSQLEPHIPLMIRRVCYDAGIQNWRNQELRLLKTTERDRANKAISYLGRLLGIEQSTSL